MNYTSNLIFLRKYADGSHRYITIIRSSLNIVVDKHCCESNKQYFPGYLNTCTTSRVHLFSMSESEWAMCYTYMFSFYGNDLRCFCSVKHYQACSDLIYCVFLF